LFVSVFEGVTAGRAFVRSVAWRAPGVLVIETALGTDTVTSDPAGGTQALAAGAGGRDLTGRFAVASVQAGRVVWTFTEPRGN
jgi:hypothetical protein